MRTWPPVSGSRSYTVTRWPRAAATRAHSSPAGPPPMTSTFFGDDTLRRVVTPHSPSRPMVGL